MRQLEIEVLHVGIPPLSVLRNGNHIEDRIARIQGRWYRVVDSGYGFRDGFRYRKAAGRRRIQLQDVHVVELSRAVEDPVPAARHYVSRQTPCETEPRAEVCIFVLI